MSLEDVSNGSIEIHEQEISTVKPFEPPPLSISDLMPALDIMRCSTKQCEPDDEMAERKLKNRIKQLKK